MDNTPPEPFADDKLGLKPFSERLERYLVVEHDFTEGSLVVGLNAPFGAGKTTFLSMWKADLDERRESDPALPKPIILNAWENDFCGDALMSIVTGLLSAANDVVGKKKAGQEKRLREAAKDVGWFVTGLANNLAANLTGIDPISAAELAEAKKEARHARVPDFIELYEQRNRSLRELKEALRSVFGGDQPKAFVLVDELDRCRPDFAINFLETIKHVFDVHGLVFILAVDRGQLECSAKSLFGSELKFDDYFRKFVHRTIALPKPDEQSLRKLAEHYASKYLEREGKRKCMMDIDEYRIRNIVQLVGSLVMPPRQVQEAFRIIGHVVAGDAEKTGRMISFLGVGVIMMSILKVARPVLYDRIGRGKASHLEVGKFLIELLGAKESEWWFKIYLTGAGDRKGDDAATVEMVLRELGYLEKGATYDQSREFESYSSGWGYVSESDRWKQVFEKIETANTF